MGQQIQPRKPRGTPIGGQWTATELADAQTTLARRAERSTLLNQPDVEALLAARRRQLAEEGFAPAMLTRAVADPRTTAGIDDWWDNQMVAAEYRADGSFPQMPDDYTLSGQGRALSGKRRTHRMRYSAGGVDLRMPSRSAINRFMKESGSDIVDVPVAAVTAGQDGLQGWVRITRHGKGLYSAEGLAMKGHTEVAIAESVAATMEGRSAQRSARSYADLVTRREDRRAELGVAGNDVDSSWIDTVAYDDATGTMFTAMTSGRTYGHKVPRSVYDRLVAAPSPGSVFNREVKGSLRAEGIGQCSTCGRFTAASGGHVCPDKVSAKVAPVNPLAAAYTGMVPALSVPAPEPATPVQQDPPASVAPAAATAHVVSPDEDSVDIAELWAEHSARPTPQRSPLYAERGWTTAAARTLAPHTTSTYVPYMYRSFLGNKASNDGDLVRFAGLEASGAAQLLKDIPTDALDHRQDDSPTLRSLLRAAAANPGEVELNGYVVTPARSDERVTVEGVYIFDEDLADALPPEPENPGDDADPEDQARFEDDYEDYTVLKRAFYDRISERYDFDELATPSLKAKETPWRPGERCLYLEWWD